MKKFTLLHNEKIVYQIRFSFRVLLLDILVILLTFSLAVQYGKTSIISFLMMILFFIVFIKTLIDIYRIFFHKVYISNYRVIYVRGIFLKRINPYLLKDIVGVYFKSYFLDRAQNMLTFKVNLKDNQSFFIRNVRHGKVVAELLSQHLVKSK
ncbi:MAG TPA: hypothetical protein VIK84_07765 [Haloplasmataceae bacterium]